MFENIREASQVFTQEPIKSPPQPSPARPVPRPEETHRTAFLPDQLGSST
jgi:hypothetical protein